MKKTILFVLTILMMILFVGCVQNEPSEKTEEELRAEIKAELEAEMNAEVNAEVNAEEIAQETTIEADDTEKQSEDSIDLPGNLTADDPVFDFFSLDVDGMETKFGKWNEKTGYLGADWYIYDNYTFAFVNTNNNYELIAITVNKGNDFMNVMIGDSVPQIKAVLGTPKDQYQFVDEEGFSERLEGYYTSYAVESFNVEFYSKDSESPTRYVEITKINSETASESETDNNSSELPAIEKGLDYYSFKANEKIFFDLNDDGVEEVIEYVPINDWSYQLIIDGYGTIEGESDNLEKNNFSIIKYEDPYNDNFDMYIIGILEYGPSADLRTSLYSIINAPDGTQAFVSVGTIQGELISQDAFDIETEADFNEKAFSAADSGINAPVRLSVLPITWFGRSQFIYNTTDTRLVDSAQENNMDYITSIRTNIKSDIVVYDDKDTSTKSRIIPGGQGVQFLATDNVKWVYILSDNGESGWIKGENIDLDNFVDLMNYMYD